VQLPEHMRRIVNSVGASYYYFEKFRRTAAAWPRIRFPKCEPLTEEFAKRVVQLPRLVAEKTDATGGWKWFFIDAVNSRRDLPAPSNCTAFWAAVDKADETGKMLLAGDKKTWRALVASFKDTDKYKDELSKSMRDQYARHLRVIEEAWGDDPVRALTAPEIQQVIDTGFRGTPQAGRVFRSTLIVLINHGIPRGYRDDNPAEKTEKAGKSTPYIPWPPTAFDVWFQYARIDMHLPVYSALFTGQRKTDVLAMVRPKSDATEMPLVAEKTKRTRGLIPVQIHSEYRKLIDAVPVDPDKPSVMLHLRADGEPWTYEGWKTAWQREIEKEVDGKKPLKIFADTRWVFHGLRKNAVNMLLEVGCTEDQVSAIVGMSPQMVRHYAKEVSKFRLARDAMKLLEKGWATQRVHVLGAVKTC